MQPQPVQPRRHFQPPQSSPDDGGQAVTLPEIPREALEQCALYRRLQANADFAALLRILHDIKLAELAALPAVSDQEKRRTVLTAEWQQLLQIPHDMERFIVGIEATMEERKRQIEAVKDGRPTETPVD